MSGVSMSIREYNELRDELILYKRTLEELLTPMEDLWSLEWFHEHEDAEIQLRSFCFPTLSRDAKNLILPILKDKVSEVIGDIGEFHPEDMQVIIGNIKHPKPSEVEEN